MNCPKCNSYMLSIEWEEDIPNTWLWKLWIRCIECGHIFVTYETVTERQRRLCPYITFPNEEGVDYHSEDT